MGNIICAVILAIVAIICFILGCCQLKEKGFLFNNAYIYSTKEERENMDKKPHYRQSGIVFLLISVIFLLNAIECIIKTGWIFYIVILLVVVALIYAIASSIMIEKNK